MSRLSTVASFFLCISLLAGSFALVPGAQAQNGVIANVPFEFSINNQRLAAGTYLFNFTSGSLTPSNDTLLVRNASTGKRQFLKVFPERTDAILSDGRLLFQRYGSSYYLSQIWIPGRNQYSRCVQSCSERQALLDAKNAPSTKVVVALNNPAK
jgi:hypothetical protein